MNGPRRLMRQRPDPDRIVEATSAARHVHNAVCDAAHTRGWLVGPFLPPGGRLPQNPKAR
jgi:hypothetical protein